MATFAKKAYDAAAYSSFRPLYPPRLYDTIWAFHNSNKAGISPSSQNATTARTKEDRDTRAGWQRAVDLGCGTGQATVEIAARFQETIGVDPSSKMIEQATRMMLSQGEEDDEQRGRISYRQAPAEDLGFLDDRSVDFISAAQAVHWFDYPRLWKEIDRVLRPGGTVAFWGYSEFRVRDCPQLTPLITYYSQGSDPERIQRAVLVKHLGLSRCIPLFRTLERRRGGDEGERPQGGEASEGPEPSDLDLVVKPERDSLSAYWEQPGRAVLDGGLVAVPHPSMVLSPSSSSPSQQHGGFGDGDGVSGAELGYEAKVVSFSGEYRPDILRAFETLYRTPTATTARMGMEMQVQVQVQKEGVILVKEMDWEGLERYLRTWSSCSTYLERFPEEKERRRQGDQQNAVEERGEGEGDIVQRFLRKLKREMERTRGREERLVIEWPLTLLLYHKRSEQRTE